MLVCRAQVVHVGTTAIGVPRTLVLDGVRHRVSDRPTRWSGRGDAWDFGPVDAVDQATDPQDAGDLAVWRFQASPLGGGPTLVVDVVRTHGGWVLLGLVR